MRALLTALTAWSLPLWTVPPKEAARRHLKICLHDKGGENIMSAGEIMSKLFSNPVNTTITVITLVIVIEIVKYFLNKK